MRVSKVRRRPPPIRITEAMARRGPEDWLGSENGGGKAVHTGGRHLGGCLPELRQLYLGMSASSL